MSKTIVLTFGRMNPPTAGHEKLIEKVAKVAKNNSADFRIYASQSQDSKKNPLSYKDKIKYLKLLFPKYSQNIQFDKSVRTFLEAATKANKDGYEELIFVVGSDRVNEFSKLLEKYNGDPRLFSFKHISVVSAGERDPDAEGVTGISASKMRAFAVDGDIESFKSGLPRKTTDSVVNKLYNAVRDGMGVK